MPDKSCCLIFIGVNCMYNKCNKNEIAIMDIKMFFSLYPALCTVIIMVKVSSTKKNLGVAFNSVSNIANINDETISNAFSKGCL